MLAQTLFACFGLPSPEIPPVSCHAWLEPNFGEFMSLVSCLWEHILTCKRLSSMTGLCSILPMSVWKCWTLQRRPLWNLGEFCLLNWNDWCLGTYTAKACSPRTWHLPVCLLCFSVLPSPYFKAAWLSTENVGHQWAATVFDSFLWVHCWLTRLTTSNPSFLP